MFSIFHRFIFCCATLLLLAACGTPINEQPTPEAVAIDLPTATPVDNSDGDLTPIDSEQIATFVIKGAESEVAYSVDEEFFNRDVQFVTAVGTTQEMEGTFQLNLASDAPEIMGGEIIVDVSTLTSDSGRRDRAIRDRWLESARFPLATFVPTAIENVSGDYDSGEMVTFELVGQMTIREVTNEARFDVTAQLVGETLTATAVTSTPLLMTDYGFEPPNIANVLVVTDGVTVTIALTASAE